MGNRWIIDININININIIFNTCLIFLFYLYLYLCFHLSISISPSSTPLKKSSDRLVIYLFIPFLSFPYLASPSSPTHLLTCSILRREDPLVCMYYSYVQFLTSFPKHVMFQDDRYLVSLVSLVSQSPTLSLNPIYLFINLVRIKLSINFLAYPIPSHLAKPTSSFHHVLSIEFVRLRDETIA